MSNPLFELKKRSQELVTAIHTESDAHTALAWDKKPFRVSIPSGEGARTREKIPVLSQFQKARLPAIFALLEQFDFLDDAAYLLNELRLLSRGQGKSSSEEILRLGALVAPQLTDQEFEGPWLRDAVIRVMTEQRKPC